MFKISEKSFPHIWVIPVRGKRKFGELAILQNISSLITDIVSHPLALTILMSGKDFTTDTKEIPPT